jgi:hypothetical protein
MNSEITTTTDPEPTTAKKTTAKKTTAKKTTAKKSATSPGYVSITRGDRAYIGADLTKTLYATYPFIKQFITENKYDASREFTIYFSHTIKTESGKNSRVTAFIKTAGSNKIKTFEKPAVLSFTPDAAVKTLKTLKPLSTFTDVVLFITVHYGAKSFRYHISYTN